MPAGKHAANVVDNCIDRSEIEYSAADAMNDDSDTGTPDGTFLSDGPTIYKYIYNTGTIHLPIYRREVHICDVFTKRCVYMDAWQEAADSHAPWLSSSLLTQIINPCRSLA